MKFKPLLLVLLLVSTSGLNYAKQSQTDVQLANMIHSSIQTYYTDRKPSGTILIAKAGKKIAAESFGYADRALHIKNSVQTQYLIGSTTKQFTGAAILNILYEKALASGIARTDIIGLTAAIKADLHTPIAQIMHMPGWADQITLHHLLVHSSGIPNIATTRDFKDLSSNPDDMNKLIAHISTLQLDFTPGTKFNYSNSNYFLLSMIAQQMTGKSLAVYMQEKFFEPLGMKSTSLDYGTVNDLKQNLAKYKNLARGYEFEITRPDAPISEIKKYEHLHIASGAGGMVSTAPDLILWNDALYNARVLPDFLVEMMLTPHIEGGNSSFHAYGYGIGVMNYPGIGVVYEHAGKIPGYVSNLVYIPSLQLSIVCLSNLMYGGDDIHTATKNIRATLPADISYKERNARIDEEIIKMYPAYATNEKLYDTRGFVNYFLAKLPQLNTQS
ncbi:MAG TPA: serine hydrolase domain-containing protein [Gammaproteobacteria bacterium]|nr:serine hydrolase domain-containing protein [Gammaproteobacteria bacterium]